MRPDFKVIYPKCYRKYAYALAHLLCLDLTQKSTLRSKNLQFSCLYADQLFSCGRYNVQKLRFCKYLFSSALSKNKDIQDSFEFLQYLGDIILPVSPSTILDSSIVKTSQMLKPLPSSFQPPSIFRQIVRC